MTGARFKACDIQSAHFCPPPAFATRRPTVRGRKALGLRYERQAQAHLERQSEWYLAGPWIIFIVAGRPHWCQPDGLHFDPVSGFITIVEIKSSHTAEAHRQLRGVYEPVIRAMFSPLDWHIRLVEVVRFFDCDVRFPEPVVMCPDPFIHASASIGVHIWKE